MYQSFHHFDCILGDLEENTGLNLVDFIFV